MCMFYIGGVVQGGQQFFFEVLVNGKVEFCNVQILLNVVGEQIVVGCNMVLVIMGEDGEECVQYKVGYGLKVFLKDGIDVVCGDKMFEWDLFILLIIVEKDGKVKFVDLILGILVCDEIDDVIGMIQKIVLDWCLVLCGGDFKLEIFVIGVDGEFVCNEVGNLVVYIMLVDVILLVEDGQDIVVGDVVVCILCEGVKIKDIIGGLFCVVELFEVCCLKDYVIIVEIDGYVCFGKDYKNKCCIVIESLDDLDIKVEYMVLKGKYILV